MNPILIVGEAPGRTDKGRTRTRISELSGHPWEEWADWRNLIEEWPGPARRGASAWNGQLARRNAPNLPLENYDLTILLGRRVAAAVLPGGAGWPFFRQHSYERGVVTVVPHTSGINRWWNDPENVERGAEFLRQVATEALAGRTLEGLAKGKEAAR